MGKKKWVQVKYMSVLTFSGGEMMGNRGSIVSGVLLLGGIIMLLAIPMVSVVSAGYKTSIHDQMQTQAFYLAEAGLEHGRQAAQSLLNAYAATGNWRPSLILNTTILELNENMSTGSYWVVAEVCQSGILNTYDLLIESVGYAGQGKVGKKLSQEFSFMFVPDGKGGGGLSRHRRHGPLCRLSPKPRR